MRAPEVDDRMYSSRKGEICVYLLHFRYGLHFSLHPSISEIPTDLEICIAQLHPNTIG